MITDQEARQAFERLHDITTQIAVAKAELHRLEHRRKAAHAISMTQMDGTVADKTAAAYKSKSYVDALNAEIEAIATFEGLRAENRVHEIACEMWRTTQANFRAVSR